MQMTTEAQIQLICLLRHKPQRSKASSNRCSMRSSMKKKKNTRRQLSLKASERMGRSESVTLTAWLIRLQPPRAGRSRRSTKTFAPPARNSSRAVAAVQLSRSSLLHNRPMRRSSSSLAPQLCRPQCSIVPGRKGKQVQLSALVTRTWHYPMVHPHPSNLRPQARQTSNRKCRPPQLNRPSKGDLLNRRQCKLHGKRDGSQQRASQLSRPRCSNSKVSHSSINQGLLEGNQSLRRI